MQATSDEAKIRLVHINCQQMWKDGQIAKSQLPSKSYLQHKNCLLLC